MCFIFKNVWLDGVKIILLLDMKMYQQAAYLQTDILFFDERLLMQGLATPFLGDIIS